MSVNPDPCCAERLEASPADHLAAPERGDVLPGAQRLHECLAESLRERLCERRLLPGAAIDEAQLCRHYGVSRAVLGAALRLLAADGLLRLRPDGGFAVCAAGREDIARLCELLAQVDSHTLCCLAGRMRGEVLAALDGCRRADEPALSDAAAALGWFACLRERAAMAGVPVFAALGRQLRRQLQLALGPDFARVEGAAAAALREPLAAALLQCDVTQIERLCRMHAAILSAAAADSAGAAPRFPAGNECARI